MTPELRALVEYRLSQSRDALRAAERLLESRLWRDAINRSYYAQFYAVLALLALRGLGTSKHSGAISLFDREFVRTGVFPKELSQALHRSFETRQEADYQDLAAVDEEDARSAYARGTGFVARAQEYLESQIRGSDAGRSTGERPPDGN